MEYRSFNQQPLYNPSRAFEGMYRSRGSDLYRSSQHNHGDDCGC